MVDHEARKAQFLYDASLRTYGVIERQGYTMHVLGTTSKRGRPLVRLGLVLPTSGAFAFLDVEPATLREAIPEIEHAIEAELARG